MPRCTAPSANSSTEQTDANKNVGQLNTSDHKSKNPGKAGYPTRVLRFSSCEKKEKLRSRNVLRTHDFSEPTSRNQSELLEGETAVSKCASGKSGGNESDEQWLFLASECVKGKDWRFCVHDGTAHELFESRRDGCNAGSKPTPSSFLRKNEKSIQILWSHPQDIGTEQ